MDTGMDTQKGSSAFDALFTKSVPHILERIFLSLDYESLKSCLEVSITWMEIIKSRSFHKRAKYLFQEEISKDEVILWQKSWAGNTKAVKRLLLSGLLDVNHVQSDYVCQSFQPKKALTSLGVAASRGHKDVVQVLLEKGAHLNKAHEFALTPLQKSVSLGRKVMVQMLLDGGAEPNLRDDQFSASIYEYGLTPLQEAVGKGKANLVKLLLDRGAKPNVSDKFGKTPLHQAAENGQANVVQLLLDGGADQNATDKDGETPLSWASSKTVAQLLLKKGLGPNKGDNSGRTPLHWASARGYKDVVDVFLQKGANTNQSDKDGETPLHSAILRRHRFHDKLSLVSKFRDNQDTETIKDDAKDVVKLLLDHGAEPNKRDKSRRTPLCLASMYGIKGVVDVLLQKGADPNMHER